MDFIQVSQAYELLSDPGRRAEYDSSLLRQATLGYGSSPMSGSPRGRRQQRKAQRAQQRRQAAAEAEAYAAMHSHANQWNSPVMVCGCFPAVVEPRLRHGCMAGHEGNSCLAVRFAMLGCSSYTAVTPSPTRRTWGPLGR
jgi:curved DNA-binding protein CbpA